MSTPDWRDDTELDWRGLPSKKRGLHRICAVNEAPDGALDFLGMVEDTGNGYMATDKGGNAKCYPTVELAVKHVEEGVRDGQV